MKQGRASSSGMGSTKIEPRSHGINPGYTAQIGIKQGNHATEQGKGLPVNKILQPMHDGRGFRGPTPSTTQHHCGSQGRHK